MDISMGEKENRKRKEANKIVMEGYDETYKAHRKDMMKHAYPDETKHSSEQATHWSSRRREPSYHGDAVLCIPPLSCALTMSDFMLLRLVPKCAPCKQFVD